MTQENKDVIYLGGKTQVSQEPIKLVTESSTEPEKKGGFKALLPYLIPIAISFLIVQFYFVPSFQTETTQAIAQMKKTGDDIKALITPLQTQVTGIDNAVRSLNGETASIRGSLANYATSGSISSLQTGITTVQNDLNGVKTNIANLTTTLATKNDVQASIQIIKDQLAKDEDLIATLRSQVNSLQSSTTSNNPGVTTSTSGNVSVTLTGNWLNPNSTQISFPALDSVNKTATMPFTFQLTNNTGRTINNVQLGVLLYILDTNNNYLMNGLPNVTMSLSSMGLGAIWTQQDTGVLYVRAFSNTSTTGLFGNLGTISQAPGTATYTVSVTVTMSGSGSVNAFNLYPALRIVSYN